MGAKLLKNAAPGSLVQTLQEVMPPAKPSEAQKGYEHPDSSGIASSSGSEELHHTGKGKQHEKHSKADKGAGHGKKGKDKHGEET